MLEFKTLHELSPNPEILELIKDFKYKVNKGKIKHCFKTNLQFIEPITYQISYPVHLTILEYKINEISNKPFYIKEHNKKYCIKEIKQILSKIQN